METATRTNYIFVDYENIQELDLDLIAGKSVKVFLIIGRRQKSVPTSLAKQILKYHDQVQLIESESTGRNALDMVLAYQVGAQAKTDPQGYFHILSKDKDYDALIKHLRASGIPANRVDAFAKALVPASSKHPSLEDRVRLVVERLRKTKASRPKRQKSLLTNINEYCRKELSDAEVQKIMDSMVARKMIELTPQGGVVYRI